MKRDRPTATVGVRELRQNLSRYLRRIEAGETLRVTEHGRPVAVLGPLPEAASAGERLVHGGRARPPALDLADLGPPKPLPVRRSASAALDEERGEGWAED